MGATATDRGCVSLWIANTRAVGCAGRDYDDPSNETNPVCSAMITAEVREVAWS